MPRRYRTGTPPSRNNWAAESPALEFQLRRAAAAVAAGGVIAYPTEAVWGLGCDPFQPLAVQRLLQLKARAGDKGLILVAGDWRQLGWLLDDLSPTHQARLRQSWPGPNTWLIPHRGRVPAYLCGRFDTIALRISAHPPVVALCAALDAPLVSTSANPSGARPATRLFQVHRYFGQALDQVLPGPLGGDRTTSVIRDLESGRLVRGGRAGGARDERR